jgi:hypothetical protein
VNRPPPGSGPRGEPGPDTPWHQQRPASGDPTGIARPRPPQQRPQPPTPPQPAHRPPTPGRPPQGPEIPWYLQRPERVTPPPPVEHRTPPTEPTPSGANGRTGLLPWLLVGAGALAVLIGAAVVIVKISDIGIGGDTLLDVSKVQTGVLQTLSDPASGYGANNVSDVNCNGGRNPSARRGTTFTCTATVNGAQRQVTVAVSDDSGTYEVDRPR